MSRRWRSSSRGGQQHCAQMSWLLPRFLPKLQARSRDTIKVRSPTFYLLSSRHLFAFAEVTFHKHSDKGQGWIMALLRCQHKRGVISSLQCEDASELSPIADNSFCFTTDRRMTKVKTRTFECISDLIILKEGALHFSNLGA